MLGAHRGCEEEHVAELTSLLREPRPGTSWPADVRLHPPRAAAPRRPADLVRGRGRLACGGRRRRVKIDASWPWATDIVIAWNRINALPQAPDQRQAVPAIKEGASGTRGTAATRPFSRAVVIPGTRKHDPAHLASPWSARRESLRLSALPIPVALVQYAITRVPLTQPTVVCTSLSSDAALNSS